jgi:hypothetical protein
VDKCNGTRVRRARRLPLRLACSRALILDLAVALLWRKRQESLPVSTMSQWWVRRSSRAVVILASVKTLAHSAKVRLVVIITLVCS